MMDSAPDVRFVKADDVAYRVVDGEAVLVHIVRDEVFVLNEVSARIVELIERPVTFAALMASLLSEYDVDSERLESDVRAHLETLIGEGIVRVFSG